MDYTKGEWQLEMRVNDNIIRIKSTPPNSSQTHQIGEVYGTHGEDMVNAHLIASAPAIYEALENLLAFAECPEFHRKKPLVSARRVLAKAKGIGGSVKSFV